ncbi:MAG: aminoglycoside phosphotransferase family protein [Candidatus Nanohaloarchaea archaeon]
MGELQEERADKLAEALAENKEFLKKEELERYENDTQTGHNYRTENYFLKIEKYFNQRERMSVEPAVLENIDIQASAPEIIDYGHINGYNYRIFSFVEGESLSHKQDHSFEDLEPEKQKERIRQMGKALAQVHESKSFDNFGNIQTLDQELIGASDKKWVEGLKDIQYFWHRHVGGQPFEEIKEEIEKYYNENKGLLNKVDKSVLIHQELGFHNVLFDEESVSIVDWESAAAGDPLLDIVTAEVILFWFQGLQESLRKEFRETYLSVRNVEFNEELVEIYRVVELSRLLMIFDDDNDKVDRIQEEILSIISE